jgi:hypothetical protein
LRADGNVGADRVSSERDWKLTATAAPRSANANAIARPMPREAPVTKATRP